MGFLPDGDSVGLSGPAVLADRGPDSASGEGGVSALYVESSTDHDSLTQCQLSNMTNAATRRLPVERRRDASGQGADDDGDWRPPCRSAGDGETAPAPVYLGGAGAGPGERRLRFNRPSLGSQHGLHRRAERGNGT